MQAEKFGAEIIFPAAVSELVCLGPAGPYRLEFAGGGAVTARTVVIASGARYRRPAIADIERYEGRGVWYWASPLEARLCAGAEVALVGGGNSAGQAAVYLSGHAARVNLLIRGPDINRNMSRYLVERIEATPNVEVRTETEITALADDPARHLEGLTWVCRRSGEAATRPIRNLFLFVGADPETSWVRPCKLKLDRSGFVLTGTAVPGAAPDKPPLEASLPGVFAIGDVRSGIGEAGRRRDRRGRGGGGGDPRRAGDRRGLSDAGCASATPSMACCGCWRGRSAPPAGARGVVLQPYRGYGSTERIFVIGRAFWQRTDREPAVEAEIRDILRRIRRRPVRGRPHPRALLRGRARGRDRSRRLFPHRDGAGRPGAARPALASPRADDAGARRGSKPRPRSTSRPTRRGWWWSPTSTTR